MVLCTPPFEKPPIKTHRFYVLPPLKNHCFWWALISGWAFISANMILTVFVHRFPVFFFLRKRNSSIFRNRCHVVDDKAVMRLAGPINDPRACSQCPLATVCTLFYKTVEEPRELRILSNPDHYMHTMAAERLQHLEPLHLAYFERWMLMMYMEVQNGQKNVSLLDLWLKRGAVGEENGKPENGAGGLRLKQTKVTSNQQLCYCLASGTPSTVALNAGDLILLREDSNEGKKVQTSTIQIV